MSGAYGCLTELLAVTDLIPEALGTVSGLVTQGYAGLGLVNELKARLAVYKLPYRPTQGLQLSEGIQSRA
jgi:hypothetical protein